MEEDLDIQIHVGHVMAGRSLSTSSFVTEILKTAGKLEKEDINTRLDTLCTKIRDFKTSVHTTLSSRKYDEFLPNLQATLVLSGRVKTLSSDIESASTKIEQEIKGQLNTSTSEFHDLSLQLQESQGILSVLDRLIAINDRLDAADDTMKSQTYSKTVSELAAIKALLSETSFEREQELSILNAIQTEYRVRMETLLHTLGEAWDATISWEISTGGATCTELRFDGLDTDSDLEHFREVANALMSLDQLDHRLKPFSENLLDIVRGVVSDDTVQVTVESGTEHSSLAAQLGQGQRETSLVCPSPGKAFSTLKKIFSFVYKYFNIEIAVHEPSAKGTLMAQLGRLISEHLLDLLIKDVLAHSIPRSNKELDTYHKVVKVTETFSQTLVELQLAPAESTQLLDYVQNINVLFANKKCQEILEKARRLMTSDIHNIMPINPDEPPIATDNRPVAPPPKPLKINEPNKVTTSGQLSDSTFKLPACHISVHVEFLLTLAHETLQEATESSKECATQLYYCVRNMFELFCSVVPVYHKDNLAALPQLAAVHHNDCMYLAHHLLTLGHLYRTRLPEPLKQGSTTFVDLVPNLRRLGTTCFLDQMTSQRDQMLEMLKLAKGFGSVSEDHNFNDAERALKQVLHQLTHLGHVWKEVLPVNIYHKAIGTLLNSCLCETINAVCALEDISADDATQLHFLLTMVEDRSPELFLAAEGGSQSKAEAQAELIRHVPRWLKFKELLVVLNAGLQEINDHWANGKGPLAVQFTAMEVRQLIRALFQNTERRANVLAKIRAV